MFPIIRLYTSHVICLAAALGCLVLSLAVVGGPGIHIAFAQSDGGATDTPSNPVFAACGEAPADTPGAEVPSLGGEPVPGSFSCGPSEPSTGTRRAENADARGNHGPTRDVLVQSAGGDNALAQDAPVLGTFTVTTAPTANVRAGASTQYAVVSVVRSGDQFDVLDQMQAGSYVWYQLALSDDASGWIRGDLGAYREAPHPEKATVQGGDDEHSDTPPGQVVLPESPDNSSNSTGTKALGEVPPPGEEEAEPNLDPVLLKTATQTIVLDAKSWEGVPPENVPQVEAYNEDMLTAYQVNMEWLAVSKNTPGLQGISFIDFLNRRAAGERMEMTYVARNIETRKVIEVTQELGPLTFTGSPDDGSLKITLDPDANPQYEIHFADITYYDMPLTYGWGAGGRSGIFYDPANPTKVIMYNTFPVNDLWQPPFPGYDQWWYDEAIVLTAVTTGFDTLAFALEDHDLPPKN